MEKQSNNSNSSTMAGDKLQRTRRAPFLIGVAGGTASGKSTVCEKIMENLRQMHQVMMMRMMSMMMMMIMMMKENMERHVVHISQDSFYRDLKQAEKVRAAKGLYNFDHPGTFYINLKQNNQNNQFK